MIDETQKIDLPLPQLHSVPPVCYANLPTPSTIAEAKEMKDFLIGDCNQIDNQLRDYKAGVLTVSSNGEALTDEWRLSAARAKSIKAGQIRIIKTWMAQAHDIANKTSTKFQQSSEDLKSLVVQVLLAQQETNTKLAEMQQIVEELRSLN